MKSAPLAVVVLLSTFPSLSSSSDLSPRTTERSNSFATDTTIHPRPDTPDPSSGLSIRPVYFVAGATALTVGLIETDQQTYNVLDRWRHHSRALETISPFLTNFGDGKYSAGLFGGYVGYGLLFNNGDAVQLGKVGLESFAATGVAVQFLKLLFGREQPNAATAPRGLWHGPFSYFHRRPLTGMGSYDAFPSGHTATVFSAATTIADWYHTPWISYTSYSIATGVAISRVMERMHWMSDCFVGGIVGIFGTRLVERVNFPDASLDLQPAARQGTYGVRIAYRW